MARADRRSRVDDFYRRVAETLIERMQEGKATWTQAWEPGANSLPYNVKTGKPYRGGNTVWLAEKAAKRGYGDARWGTFKQVKDLGGHVRRGEKGCQILFWQFESKRLARGQGTAGRFWTTRGSRSTRHASFRARGCIRTRCSMPTSAMACRPGPSDGALRHGPARGGGAGLPECGCGRAAFRGRPGLLRPRARPDRPALPGPVPQCPVVLPDRAARAGPLDGPPRPAQPGDARAGYRGRILVHAVRPRGAAGGNQLDDDRRPAEPGT